MFDRIHIGSNAPEEINVIIEIPSHSDPVKYEVNKATGAIFVDRFLNTAMHYPCNYGYIPQTLAQDGDPVDVMVVTPIPVMAGAVIICRPVAMLRMIDEAGIDYKILAVPVNKLCSLYDKVYSHADLSDFLIKKIEHFFAHYKDLEPNKWVKLDGWVDANIAKDEINKASQRYLSEQKEK